MESDKMVFEMAVEVIKTESASYPPGLEVTELPKDPPEVIALSLERMMWLFDGGEREWVAKSVARLRKLGSKKITP